MTYVRRRAHTHTYGAWPELQMLLKLKSHRMEWQVLLVVRHLYA